MQTISKHQSKTIAWSGQGKPPQLGSESIRQALFELNQPVCLVETPDGLGVSSGGSLALEGEGDHPVQAFVPALHPSSLGDRSFCEAHGVEMAYVAGAMANGIASVELVEAMAQAGFLAFFGSAGLPLPQVEAAIDRLQKSLKDKPFGSNLIHSPNEPDLEEGVVKLYLDRGVRRVSASAYLGLTESIVWYRVKGIHRDGQGRVVVPNQVLAKVSRIEVASRFFAPPPEKLLRALVEKGKLSQDEATLAAEISMADDLTAEADSGGHTDNRPALALVPTMIALRDEMQVKYGFKNLRVGAAGGIATPISVSAAFQMGASYVVTGSVNQACLESGSCDAVREMLAKARQADVAMAPAADMFEMGVQVQVLKYGTLFPVRAKKLYELYRNYESLEQLPAKEKQILERDFFRHSVETEWANTKKFFQTRDPRQNERAERDAKHKMALVFRSYLGRSSGWANAGVSDRKVDYQIWCGPAMGAFNQWVKGSFLEGQQERRVATVAKNLMVGAAYLSRINWIRQQGVILPIELTQYDPRRDVELDELLRR